MKAGAELSVQEDKLEREAKENLRMILEAPTTSFAIKGYIRCGWEIHQQTISLSEVDGSKVEFTLRVLHTLIDGIDDDADLSSIIDNAVADGQRAISRRDPEWLHEIPADFNEKKIVQNRISQAQVELGAQQAAQCLFDLGLKIIKSATTTEKRKVLTDFAKCVFTSDNFVNDLQALNAKSQPPILRVWEAQKEDKEAHPDSKSSNDDQPVKKKKFT